jgi:hypothetical protein
MAVNINLPSQVRTFANLAAFPASGAVKTIYIAEDTNKTYRWDGSTYVEISASAATGLTVGTTPIASGTVGRVLFEGTGNVLQESANLLWDNTKTGLSILSTTSASADRGVLIKQFNTGVQGALSTFQKSRGTIASPLDVQPNDLVGLFQFSARLSGAYTADRAIFGANMATTTGIGLFFSAGSSNGSYIPSLYIHPSGNAVFGSTQSILTGITDTGFKLDVNGTARVSGLVTATLSNYNSTHSGNTTRGFYIVNSADSIVRAGIEYDGTNAFVQLAGRFANGAPFFRQDGGNGNISFLRNGVEFGRFFGTGNLGVNTGTDAGFRLDVNGTARVGDNLLLTNGIIATSTATTRLQGSLNYFTHNRIASSGIHGFQISNYGSTTSFWRYDAGTGDIEFGNSTAYGVTFFANNLARTKMWSSGQWTMGSATAYNASALVAMESTTTGFLPPRMTTTQRNAISSPAAGLQVYDTTLNRPCFYDGTTWITL